MRMFVFSKRQFAYFRLCMSLVKTRYKKNDKIDQTNNLVLECTTGLTYVKVFAVGISHFGIRT